MQDLTKQEYLLVIKALLLAQGTDDFDDLKLQKLIRHFDQLYQQI